MNLFLKIFFWFLAAIALMIGVVVFLNWTVQTEPAVSRWQNSVRNQITIYAATAAQVHATQGDDGMREFLARVRASNTITEVDVISRNGRVTVGEIASIEAYRPLIDRALASDDVQIDTSVKDTVLAAKKFTLADGADQVLIVRWERFVATPLFGESRMRYLRYLALFLTALLVCYALARYLSSPISKIRSATQKLAEGDLRTRVAGEVGNRRDELARLAADFDVMAERIETLVTSQQRLTRDISHELRSPLARMNVALELAKQKTNGDSTPLLERIDKESGRLNEMISRLLTLASLESGSQDFERRELNLTSIIEQIAADADFEAQAVGKNVKIIKADKCRVLGGETLVRSAIENVLRNAVRHTVPGSSVEVALTSDNGSAAVQIQDSGGGVPEGELKNLFRPFYRVGEARERKTGGVGLGLAIAEQAIKAHGGSITATNSNGGLLVRIRLDCR